MTGDAPSDFVHPRRHVGDDLGNRVGVAARSGLGLRRGQAGDDLRHRRAVPWIAIERTMELVDQKGRPRVGVHGAPYLVTATA